MKILSAQLFSAFSILTLAAFTLAPASRTLPPAAALTLSATNKTVDKGTQVCVEVRAKDFQQILTMQYSMKWDKNVLKFKEVKSFGLPGMSVQSFGTHLAEKGILTYSWYDANIRGISKPDGHKLYEVCFEVTGQPGSKSYFQFTDYPTIIEISNSAGNFLELKSENGLIKVR
jgi:hypothetical protein